ncbi:methyltransferase [Azospirillum sp.]|uniref:methyltransferase n=1 Tax=Azospirillum sp. TaxID=34012 RepID=UPI003D748A2B
MSKRLAQRADSREAEIAAVAADALEGRVPAGSLVCGDPDGAVEAALGGPAWNRFAYDGRPAQPWPPEGAFPGAVLRQPRGWGAFAMTLHALAARLPEGAPLWIYGGNDEGVTSIPKRLEGLFGEPETLAIKRRARVLELRRTGAPARGGLEDWREVVGVGGAELVSYPGLFAHGRLDPGTELLLGALPKIYADQSVLDFGCGAGVIAHTVRRMVPEVRLTLLDMDSVALHAARQNVPDAAHVLSDGWSAVPAKRDFDLILSNPPLHRGKEEDFGALEALVRGAKDRLKPRGALIAVVQRSAGVGKLFASTLKNVEALAEKPQYQVWRGGV